MSTRPLPRPAEPFRAGKEAEVPQSSSSALLSRMDEGVAAQQQSGQSEARDAAPRIVMRGPVESRAAFPAQALTMRAAEAATPKTQSPMPAAVAAAIPARPPASPPVLPAISAQGSIDVGALRGFPRVQQQLKSVPGKDVFLVKFGSKLFVAKAGTNYIEARDHVVNTDLFRQLQLPKLDAPRVAEITGLLRVALNTVPAIKADLIPKPYPENDPAAASGNPLYASYKWAAENAPGVLSEFIPYDTIASVMNDPRSAGELLQYAQSPEGATGLGRIACIDLLCGMDDRIVGKFNRDNLMINRADMGFWCIDNAKNPLLGLCSGGDGAWQAFLFNPAEFNSTRPSRVDGLENISWAVRSSIYDALDPGGGSNVLQTKQYIEFAILDTLLRVQKFMDAPGSQLAPDIRGKLSARLGFLRARIDFVTLLDFDEFSRVPGKQETGAGPMYTLNSLLAAPVADPNSIGKQKTSWGESSWAAEIKGIAAGEKSTIDKMAQLDQVLCNYLVKYPNADAKGVLLDALKVLRTARYKRALQASAAALTSRPVNAPRVWGEIKLGVLPGLRKTAAAWGVDSTAVQSFEDAFAAVTGVRAAAPAAAARGGKG